MASINEEEYQSLSYNEQKDYVKEFACTCNECGKKWHYLEEVAKKVEEQIQSNTCSACSGGGTSSGMAELNTENRKLELQLAKLKACPECGSSNVSKKAKYFQKE